VGVSRGAAECPQLEEDEAALLVYSIRDRLSGCDLGIVVDDWLVWVAGVPGCNVCGFRNARCIMIGMEDNFVHDGAVRPGCRISQVDTERTKEQKTVLSRKPQLIFVLAVARKAPKLTEQLFLQAPETQSQPKRWR
jgi:hypothetical protein